MCWNLRMVAAERGVWESTDLRRALSDAGPEISAGKMSHLWSGTPISLRLDDIDVICAVLCCTPGDLLLPEEAPVVPAVSATAERVRPVRRASGHCSTPPAGEEPSGSWSASTATRNTSSAAASAVRAATAAPISSSGCARAAGSCARPGGRCATAASCERGRHRGTVRVAGGEVRRLPPQGSLWPL